MAKEILSRSMRTRVLSMLSLLTTLILVVACASPSVTPAPSAPSSPGPTLAITASSTPMPTSTPTLTSVPTLTLTAAPTPILTPTSMSTPASTPTPTPVPTPKSTSVPTPNPIPVPTPKPTAPPKPGPTATPNLTYHVPILMYHRVVPDDKANQVLNHLLVTPANFEAELKLLAVNGWKTITLDALAQDMAQGVKVPAKTFVLTLDDGWYDGYVYAWPIIQKYGFVGTFFIISSRIGSPSTISADQMRELEAAGNEIGDHTVSHYDLTGHPYQVDYSQICQAADAIAAVTGQRPVSFAYPMGGYDANALKAVAACPGIKIAVTEKAGATESWKTRFLAERVAVNRGDTAAGVLSEMQALTK